MAPGELRWPSLSRLFDYEDYLATPHLACVCDMYPEKEPALPAQAYEHKFENRTLFYRFHLDAVGPAPDGAGPSTSWCDALCESLCVPVIAPLHLFIQPRPHSNPNSETNPNFTSGPDPNPDPYIYPNSNPNP